jgi:hypothetical protein
MIVRPHCDFPVTSVGIGSSGTRSMPTIRPHTALSQRTISITLCPLSVGHVPRIDGLVASAAGRGKAMRNAGLMMLIERQVGHPCGSWNKGRRFSHPLSIWEQS